MSSSSTSDDDDNNAIEDVECEPAQQHAPMPAQTCNAVTAAAVAALVSRSGFSEEDATALMSDPALVAELELAYNRIREAGAQREQTEGLLHRALQGGGLDPSDVAEMMREIDALAAAEASHSEENHRKHDPDGLTAAAAAAAAAEGADEADEEQDAGDGEDTAQDEKDNAEFSSLLDSLTAAGPASNRTGKAAKLLPVLPTVAEFAGSFATIFGLGRACRSFRALLFSGFLERRLWIALAITEYPLETSELGEDAFLTVQSWSTVVRSACRMRYRREIAGLVSLSSK